MYFLIISPQYELYEKKKVTISSNLPIFFKIGRATYNFPENDITSSVYRFLQIQVPCSSYSKLYKDLVTINLVDQVSKL